MESCAWITRMLRIFWNIQNSGIPAAFSLTSMELVMTEKFCLLSGTASPEVFGHSHVWGHGSIISSPHHIQSQQQPPGMVRKCKPRVFGAISCHFKHKIGAQITQSLSLSQPWWVQAGGRGAGGACRALSPLCGARGGPSPDDWGEKNNKSSPLPQQRASPARLKLQSPPSTSHFPHPSCLLGFLSPEISCTPKKNPIFPELKPSLSCWVLAHPLGCPGWDGGPGDLWGPCLSPNPGVFAALVCRSELPLRQNS